MDETGGGGELSGQPWAANPPRTKLAAAVLKEFVRLSKAAVGPAYPDSHLLATADGSFAGLGCLDIDDRGNVILIRVAEHEDHLFKGERAATAMDMWLASQFSGGSPSSGSLPTSASGAAWLQQFGTQKPFVGTFKIPARELLGLARDGKAILGNNMDRHGFHHG